MTSPAHVAALTLLHAAANAVCIIIVVALLASMAAALIGRR